MIEILHDRLYQNSTTYGGLINIYIWGHAGLIASTIAAPKVPLVIGPCGRCWMVRGVSSFSS